jgi:hypothetical protein
LYTCSDTLVSQLVHNVYTRGLDQQN